jgi:hypothetical protein
MERWVATLVDVLEPTLRCGVAGARRVDAAAAAAADDDRERENGEDDEVVAFAGIF